MTANRIARMTGKRLMSKFGDGLPLAVEEVIQTSTTEPGQFDLAALPAGDGIAILIVQCAQFAFDWKHKNGGGGKDEIEALKRELRLMAAKLEGVGEKVRGEVVEAVAEEAECGE